jgi:hypothetical protein
MCLPHTTCAPGQRVQNRGKQAGGTHASSPLSLCLESHVLDLMDSSGPWKGQEPWPTPGPPIPVLYWQEEEKAVGGGGLGEGERRDQRREGREGRVEEAGKGKQLWFLYFPVRP